MKNGFIKTSVLLSMLTLVFSCSDNNGTSVSNIGELDKFCETNSECEGATVIFPPLHSVTTSDEITIRGTLATNNLQSVQINGVDVSTTDDFLTWQVTIPMSLGENTLSFTATGQGNNTLTMNDMGYTIRREAPLFEDIEDVIHDDVNNRLFALDDDLLSIFEYDLETNERTIFTDNQREDALFIAGYEISSLEVAAINKVTNELVVLLQLTDSVSGNEYNDSIIAVDLDNGNRRLIAATPHFMDAKAMIIDASGLYAYATDWHNERIIELDLNDGTYQVFGTYLDFGVPDHNRYYRLAWYGDEILWGTNDNEGLYAINKNTKVSRIIYDQNTVNIDELDLVVDIAVDLDNHRVLLIERDSVSCVDLQTGVLSKLITPADLNNELTDISHGKLIYNLLYLYDDDKLEFANYDLSNLIYTAFPVANIGTAPGERVQSISSSADGKVLFVEDTRKNQIQAYDLLTGSVEQVLDLNIYSTEGRFESNAYYDANSQFFYYGFEDLQSNTSFAKLSLLNGDLEMLAQPEIPVKLYSDLSIDFDNQMAYAIGNYGAITENALIEVNMMSGTSREVSDTRSYGSNIENLLIYPLENSLFFSNEDEVIKVNIITGEQRILSDSTSGTTPSFTSSYIREMALDSRNNVLIVTDSSSSSNDAVYEISLIDGSRKLITNNEFAKGPIFDNPDSTVAGINGELLYIMDTSYNALFIVDRKTGERVIWQR